MTDTQSSVSKGVFAYKGKKAAANVKDFIEYGAKNRDSTVELCHDIWERIDEKIQLLQSDLHANIFEDLITFTRHAHKDFTPVQHGLKFGTMEIPTAALVTGVNMPDHAAMFSNLTCMIKDTVTSHTAILKSKDCSNMKTTMSNVISQLIDNTYSVDDDDDDEVIDNQVNIKRVSCTMDTVKVWYQEASKRISSPRKRKLGGSPTKSPRKSCSTIYQQYDPIVIILEDFEGFPEHILRDFITICSNHRKELPIVLIFGIATSVTTVHRLLPHQVSSFLCMEKFQAPPASEYLNNFLREVTFSPKIPFRLNGKSFRLLLDLFLYHDFSVLNFTRGFQYAMLDHYFSNPASILCQPLSDVEPQVAKLSPQQLEQIRSLQSFRRYVEMRDATEQISLLEGDTYTKEFIVKCMATIDHYHDNFFPILECLHTFVKKLPRYPLGKQLRELYSMAMVANIYEVTEYRDSLDLLRHLSRDEMLNMLTQCQEILGSKDPSEELVRFKATLAEYHQKFSDTSTLTSAKNEDPTTDDQSNVPKKTDMATLRKKLQELQNKKKKLSPYELQRNECIDYLDSVFRKHLKNPQNFPLHEALYYSGTTNLRRHMNSSPRATIQRGLSNPCWYLENQALKIEGNEISPLLPDLSIVYKLHLECGKMINLYDWLQAFITIVGEDAENVPSSNQRKPDKVLQARFIRAVSELQFLGFIKPTKRKTDHVARLTWGGC